MGDCVRVWMCECVWVWMGKCVWVWMAECVWLEIVFHLLTSCSFFSLYLADISTAKTRARTMAPGMTAFVAGIGLGPGIGGYLVDTMGASSCFFLVGALISTTAVTNYMLLKETYPVGKANAEKLLDSMKQEEESFLTSSAQIIQNQGIVSLLHHFFGPLSSNLCNV